MTSFNVKIKRVTKSHEPLLITAIVSVLTNNKTHDDSLERSLIPVCVL